MKVSTYFLRLLPVLLFFFACQSAEKKNETPDETTTSQLWDVDFKVTREGKLGLDTAHKFAYEYAIKKNYSKLITMDADLSHNPKDIHKIIQLLENSPFVIGSRYIKGGKCEMNFFRWVLSYFGNKFIKIMLNIKSNEFTTSFRGFDIIGLKNFHLQDVSSKGYSFFMETIFHINKLGFKIVELPIIFGERKYGKSKIPKIEILRTLKNVIILKFFKWFQTRSYKLFYNSDNNVAKIYGELYLW